MLGGAGRTGKPTVNIACLDVVGLPLGGRIDAPRVQQVPVHRVVDKPLPLGVVGQLAGKVGGNWSVPLELAEVVTKAHQGWQVDRELHPDLGSEWCAGIAGLGA